MTELRWRWLAFWSRLRGPDPKAIMPGHTRVFRPGPCHPLPVERGGMKPPAWVTERGCDVKRLHAAHRARLEADVLAAALGEGAYSEVVAGARRRRAARSPRKVVAITRKRTA